MSSNKIKLLCEVENSSHDDDPLMICENSVESECMIMPPLSDEIRYKVHSGVQYRLVGSTTSSTSTLISRIEPTIPTTTITNSNNSNNSQSTVGDLFLLNDLQANRPCVIYPKPTSNPPTRQIILGQTRKRDEARRATHNEVERRRRDKINQWIFKIKDLLPEEPVKQINKTSSDSKSAILIKACEYIKQIQDESSSLKTCLNNFEEIENLQAENKLLKDENEILKLEIERLKRIEDIKLERLKDSSTTEISEKC